MEARGPSVARAGRHVLNPSEWRDVEAALSLSGREFQILQCLFDDQKESVIAQGLGMSPHTVHTHLERLYRKLGVSGRGAAIVRVFGTFRDLAEQR